MITMAEILMNHIKKARVHGREIEVIRISRRAMCELMCDLDHLVPTTDLMRGNEINYFNGVEIRVY